MNTEILNESMFESRPIMFLLNGRGEFRFVPEFNTTSAMFERNPGDLTFSSAASFGSSQKKLQSPVDSSLSSGGWQSEKIIIVTLLYFINRGSGFVVRVEY